MPVVSNSSPLMWLSKIGRITLLKRLYGEVLIPEEVYKENVEKGLEEGFSDALVVRECMNDGWIKVSSLSEEDAGLCQRIMEHAVEIHVGEAQAIVMARKMDALLLMDEAAGRAFAEAWGLKVRGILYVILRALKKGYLSRGEAKEAMLLLVNREFRVEPQLLARALKEVESFTPSR